MFIVSLDDSWDRTVGLWQVQTEKEAEELEEYIKKKIEDLDLEFQFSSCEIDEVTNDGIYEVQLELKDDFVFKDQKDYLYKLDCIHHANKLFYALAESLPHFNNVE